jgi:hypothetical protein
MDRARDERAAARRCGRRRGAALLPIVARESDYSDRAAANLRPLAGVLGDRVVGERPKRGVRPLGVGPRVASALPCPVVPFSQPFAEDRTVPRLLATGAPESFGG